MCSQEVFQIDVTGSHGEVFTRRWVVELILDLAGFTADRDLASLTAVEPSCGAGAFVVPMVERVVQFRILVVAAVGAGFARIAGAVIDGNPGMLAFVFAAVELGVLPVVLIWHASLVGRLRSAP